MLAWFAWHGRQQTFCGSARPVRRQAPIRPGFAAYCSCPVGSDLVNLATLALAFSMSADAFAAALGLPETTAFAYCALFRLTFKPPPAHGTAAALACEMIRSASCCSSSRCLTS